MVPGHGWRRLIADTSRPIFTNGRWRDILTADDMAHYEAGLARNLTPECAAWLATGKLPD
jgi:hypothetical protein